MTLIILMLILALCIALWHASYTNENNSDQ